MGDGRGRIQTEPQNHKLLQREMDLLSIEFVFKFEVKSNADTELQNFIFS